MPSIFKHLSRSRAEKYVFPDASELKVEEEAQEPDPGEALPGGELAGEEAPPEPETERAPEETPRERVIDPTEPVSYAQLQAEMILQDARRRAADVLERADREARENAEKLYDNARENGRREGYADGYAEALEESRKLQEAQAAELGGEVARFLEKAGEALDRQLDASAGELRDLAIAIAEKVVAVSLRSSTEVIGRMVQAAIDKKKRKEWVHVYIAECDVKSAGQMPDSLSGILSAISDRVRIIPMADDEPGTCIIEMPDEIIDASASTQLGNIKNMLRDLSPDTGGSPERGFLF